MSERKVVYWDCSDDIEILRHDSVAEAVISWHDESLIEILPETVTVYGFARRVIDRAWLYRIVAEHLTESIDEEYGGEDGPVDEPASVQAATKAFVDSVVDDYEPWQCEIVETIEVDPREYISDSADAP